MLSESILDLVSSSQTINTNIKVHLCLINDMLIGDFDVGKVVTKAINSV